MSDLIYPRGALSGNYPHYVQRNAEKEAIRELRRMSYLMFIEARQQGKTSLINWLSDKLRPENYSFTHIDISTLANSDESAWYNDLYERILMSMDFISKTEHIYLLTTATTWRWFLVGLASFASRNGKKIVIALDEISSTRHAWLESFFRTLRDVFNSRQHEPYFKHITFLLSGRYDPASLISERNESPFNIAVRIRLPDFTAEQVSPLVATYSPLRGVSDSVVQRIYYWTAGQPYLTQLLCFYLAEQNQPFHLADVDKAVQRLQHDDQDHLPPIRKKLRKNPELREYIQRILGGERIGLAPNGLNRVQSQLEIMGLIKAGANNDCVIRNLIYVRTLHMLLREGYGDIRGKTDNKIFISYADEDEELRQELMKHLAALEREGLVTSWHDQKISAGSDRQQEINSHLNTANMILLLVSPDFISSDYCYDVEMKEAIKRHKRGGTHVIPIILRPVSWEGAPFGDLQALPRNVNGEVQAITRWANKDEAFLNIVEGIQKLIGESQKGM